MLIKARNVAVNVTVIKIIKVDLKEEVTYKNNGFFKKKTKETKYAYDVNMYYNDVNGRDAIFTWQCGERKETEAVERELLNQIKEVELEHMTATLENAIGKN
jgi:hypothetical protein